MPPGHITVQNTYDMYKGNNINISPLCQIMHKMARKVTVVPVSSKPFKNA